MYMSIERYCSDTTQTYCSWDIHHVYIPTVHTLAQSTMYSNHNCHLHVPHTAIQNELEACLDWVWLSV